MKLCSESITKTYLDDGTTKVETIKQYDYISKQEKQQHLRKMLAKGYSDSGQVMRNIGTMANPEFVYYGGYYKCEVI